MPKLKGFAAAFVLTTTTLLSTGAGAQPMKIEVGSLSTAEDVRAFETRVDATARAFCEARGTNVDSRVPNMRPCIEGVKAEIADKLSQNQRLQIAAQHGQLLASR